VIGAPPGARASVVVPLTPWLVVLVATGVYANVLANGFVMDAEGVLLRNPLVHGVDGIWRAFGNSYWPQHGGQYRPLVISAFAAEWSLWGDNAAGFLAVNAALHALASVLCYHVARRWLSFAGAAIAALVFAVHPVHVEAVANIVGRAELMAACGVLAMLLLHQRGSVWAVLAFAGTLFSKEHALIAPVLVALSDLASRQGKPRGADRKDGAETRIGPLYAGYVAVVVMWLGAVAAVFHDEPLAAIDVVWRSIDAPARWLTALGVVPTWMRLWFAPFDLSADYSPQVTALWPENALHAWLGAAVALAAVVLAAVSWTRARAVAFAVLWMMIAIAPVANVIVPTGVIVGERTLYLSSVGAVLLIGFVAERLGRARASLAVAFAAALVIVFAARVWTRTPVWESNRALILATAAEHPEASTTRLLLARVYARSAEVDSALGEYRAALRLFDRNAVVWAEAADFASSRGRDLLADSLLREARARVGPHFMIAVTHAEVALRGHRYAEALRAARDAIVLAPDSARGYAMAARAWTGLGLPDSAQATLSRAPQAAAGRSPAPRRE
jgi:tetratricopeptide (TPR) repeat protein